MKFPWEYPPSVRELPADIFQRYWLAAQLINAYAADSEPAVLDVGGAGGYLARFRDNGRSISLDLNPSVEAAADIRGDGCHLPFRDKTFAAVVSLDTVEHIPPAQRRRFVEECLRVARDVAVFTFPARGTAEQLDVELNAFHHKLTGISHPYLADHCEHPLPQVDDILSAAISAGWQGQTLASGYAPRWLASAMTDLLLTCLPLAGRLRDRLHAYNNSVFTLRDLSPPAYRSVVVLTSATALAHSVDPPVDACPPEAAASAFSSLAEAAIEFKELSHAGIQHARKLASELLEHQQQLGQAAAYSEKLRQELSAMEAVIAGQGEHIRHVTSEANRLASLIEPLQNKVLELTVLADVGGEQKRLIELRLRDIEQQYYGLEQYARKLEYDLAEKGKHIEDLERLIDKLHGDIYQARRENL